MDDMIVQTDQLSKTFKQTQALCDVSFSVRQGEVIAILGPNGAGKTTAISLILGLLKPTKGSVHIFGQDPRNIRVRERLGVMMQEVIMMDGLTANELLQLFRTYYPQPLALTEMITLTGLSEADLKTKVEKLSGGQRRRVNFAVCLAGNPDFIILDEPTTGMDTTSRAMFWETIHCLADQGKTILFSTHYLQEADNAANRIILLDRGRKIADGTATDIKQTQSKQYVSFRIHRKLEKAKLDIPDILSVEERDQRICLETKDTDALVSYIIQHIPDAYDLQIDKGSMDDVFKSLVQRSHADG